MGAHGGQAGASAVRGDGADVRIAALDETLRVLNLGASGALVEGALPLPPNAEYRMQLVLESHRE